MNQKFMGTWFVVLNLILSANAASAQRGEPNSRVNINRALKVLVAKGIPGLSIDYEYDFAGRSQVHIDGLGIVPASGHFQYVTTNTELIFSEVGTTSGAVLLRIPLHPTLSVAAKPPLTEIANITEFPLAFSAYPSSASAPPLPIRMNAVLGQHFRYRPFESDGRTFIVTTFAPLPLRGVREGVVAEIALLLSFPYDRDTGQYNFHIQSLIREGRTHSDDFRPTTDDTIVSAARAYVDGIAKELGVASGAV